MMPRARAPVTVRPPAMAIFCSLLFSSSESLELEAPLPLLPCPSGCELPQGFPAPGTFPAGPPLLRGKSRLVVAWRHRGCGGPSQPWLGAGRRPCSCSRCRYDFGLSGRARRELLAATGAGIAAVAAAGQLHVGHAVWLQRAECVCCSGLAGGLGQLLGHALPVESLVVQPMRFFITRVL